jgi:ABC-2 type transport system permease protein
MLGSKIIDSLHIIWTVAAKDIVDSLKNKLILSIILGAAVMLLMPKVMSVILVPPYKEVAVFDAGESTLLTLLDDSPAFQVRKMRSISDLEELLGSMGFGLGIDFGLAIPADFDQLLTSEDPIELDGYLTWANRGKAVAYEADFEREITSLISHPVRISTQENILFPPEKDNLLMSLFSLTSVVVIFVLGISLVPTLLFDEKQTKTMEALLVSPASIGQVVVGKAVAGLFYIVVTAAVVFGLNGSAVVHWGVALAFIFGSGLFTVAVGLLLGSYFDRQQEVTGWTMLILVIVIGTIFIDMTELQIPDILQTIISWTPSVKLAEILRASYLQHVDWGGISIGLGSVVLASLLLYGLVVRKVRQSDN